MAKYPPINDGLVRQLSRELYDNTPTMDYAPVRGYWEGEQEDAAAAAEKRRQQAEAARVAMLQQQAQIQQPQQETGLIAGLRSLGRGDVSGAAAQYIGGKAQEMRDAADMIGVIPAALGDGEFYGLLGQSAKDTGVALQHGLVSLAEGGYNAGRAFQRYGMGGAVAEKIGDALGLDTSNKNAMADAQIREFFDNSRQGTEGYRADFIKAKEEAAQQKAHTAWEQGDYLTAAGAALDPYNLRQQGLQMLPGMLAGAGATKFLGTAGNLLQGASMGSSDASSQTYQDVMRMDHGALLQGSAKYRDLIKAGYSADDAKSIVASDASSTAANIGLVTGLAANSLGAAGETKLVQNLFGRKLAAEASKDATAALTKMQVAKNLLKDAAGQFGEEALDEAGSQFAGNYGIKKNADSSKSLWDGVAESGFQGGLLGMVMGGPVAGLNTGSDLARSIASDRKAQADLQNGIRGSLDARIATGGEIKVPTASDAQTVEQAAALPITPVQDPQDGWAKGTESWADPVLGEDITQPVVASVAAPVKPAIATGLADIGARESYTPRAPQLAPSFADQWAQAVQRAQNIKALPAPTMIADAAGNVGTAHDVAMAQQRAQEIEATKAAILGDMPAETNHPGRAETASDITWRKIGEKREEVQARNMGPQPAAPMPKVDRDFESFRERVRNAIEAKPTAKPDTGNTVADAQIIKANGQPFPNQAQANIRARKESERTGIAHRAVPWADDRGDVRGFAVVPTGNPSRSNLKPMDDARLGNPDLAGAVQRMAQDEAGWAEEGGKVLRDPQTGEVTGRTSWVPKADWWRNRPKSGNRGLDENETRAAVQKAIAGQPMTKLEKDSVLHLLDEAERISNQTGLNVGPQDLAESGYTDLDQEQQQALEASPNWDEDPADWAWLETEAQAERQAIQQADALQPDQIDDIPLWGENDATASEQGIAGLREGADSQTRANQSQESVGSAQQVDQIQQEEPELDAFGLPVASTSDAIRAEQDRITERDRRRRETAPDAENFMMAGSRRSEDVADAERKKLDDLHGGDLFSQPAPAKPSSEGPTVSTMMSDGTYKNWKKTVPNLGKVNGWDLFHDTLQGDRFVLMTSYNAVGFDSEREAREWAEKNKANPKGEFKPSQPAPAKPTAATNQAPADAGVSFDEVAKDYLLYPDRVMEEISRRGDMQKLMKGAGKRAVSSFNAMTLEDRANAYADYVRNGGNRVEVPADYNAWVQSEYDAIEQRRKDSDKPIAQLAEERRIAEGRPTYTEAQSQALRELGIQENADGDIDATEAQWKEIDARTDSILRGDVSKTQPESNTSAEPVQKTAESEQAPSDTQSGADGENTSKLDYVRAQDLDHPSVGVLNQAIAHKEKAWSRLKLLKEQIKRDGLSGRQLDLIKAESAHKDALRDVASAQEAVEKAANAQGKTTQKQGTTRLYSRKSGSDSLPQAVMPRQASNFAQAREAFKHYQGKPIENKSSGMVITVSRNNIDKMLSESAVGKSSSAADHSLAVANLDHLFANAEYGWSKNDRGRDPNIVAIHRLFAPMDTQNGTKIIKLTVKEFARKDQGSKIYSVESMEIESPASIWVDSTVQDDGLDPTSTPYAGRIESLVQAIKDRNNAETNGNTLHSQGSPSTRNAKPFRAPEIRNADGKLLAPNGQPSNLNTHQWHQVRSPEFKAWFGDWENDPASASKVVDANGEPMVWYRGQIGSTAANDPFDATAIGAPSFADNPEVASVYATNPNAANLYTPWTPRPADHADNSNIIPVFISGKVFDASGLQGGLGTKTGLRPSVVAKLLRDLGINSKDVDFEENYAALYGGAKRGFFDVAIRGGNEPRIMPAYAFFDNKTVRDAIAKKGYSAIRFIGAVSKEKSWSPNQAPEAWDESITHGELRVLERGSIKSAIGNSGAFDPANPSILASEGEQRQSSTVSEIRAALLEAFGNRAQRMLDNGNVVIVQNERDTPVGAVAIQSDDDSDSPQGFYDPETNKVYLVADGLMVDDVRPVMLHEATHFLEYNKPEVMQAAMRYLQNQLDLSLRFDNSKVAAWFKEAWRKVPMDTPHEHLLSELAAYAVANRESAPATVKKWLQDMVAAFRMALVRMGWNLKEITDADLAAMARYAVRRMSQTERAAGIASGLVRAWGEPAGAMRSEETTGFGNIDHLSSDELLALLSGSTIESVEATTVTGDDDGSAESLFLSNFAESVRYDAKKSSLARAIRAYSDRIADELGGEAEARRTISARLGPFSGFTTSAEVLEPDALNPNGRLQVAVYGDEQTDAGLTDEPALIITYTPDGELVINGPSPSGETFAEFKKRGWADYARGKDGEIQPGWSALLGRNGGKLPMSQVAKIIADTHARARLWMGQDKIGIHWSRATGATGGLGGFDGRDSGREGAIYFSKSAANTAPAPGAFSQPATVNQATNTPVFDGTMPDQTLLNKGQAKLQDRMNRWKQLQNTLAKAGRTITEAMDVYGAEERFHKRLASRLEDFRNRATAITENMAKQDVDLDQMASYLYAQHAPERNASMQAINPNVTTGSGMSNDQAAEIVRHVESLPNAAQYKRFAAELRAITRESVGMMEQAGLIKPAMADAMRNKWANYVPLKGWEDADIEGNKIGTGQGMSVSRGIVRAKGRDSRAGQIIENILHDHENAIAAAEKNNVGQYVLNLVEANPDIATVSSSNTMPIIRANNRYDVNYNGSKVAEFQNRQDARDFVSREALKLGRSESKYDIDTVSREQVQDMATSQLDDNQVRVYRNGDAQVVTFKDEVLARQYKNMGVEDLGFVLGKMAAFNRYLSAMYTAKNPLFIVKNMLRDAQSGFVNLTGEVGISEAIKTLKHYGGAMNAMRRHAAGGKVSPEWAGIIADYRKHGGQTGMGWVQGLDDIGSSMRMTYDKADGVWRLVDKGRPGRAAQVAGSKMFHWLTDGIEHINVGIENAMRLAAYRQAVENGASKAKAASLAANLTVNFTRKGEAGNVAGAMYLFFNPRVQGFKRTFDTLANSEHRNQARALAASMAGVSFLITSLMVMDKDDEDYWNIPEHIRSRNWIIAWPNSKGYIALPIPPDYAPIHTAGRVMAEAVFGEKKMSAAAQDLWRSLLSAALPVDVVGDKGMGFDGAQAVQGMVPTIGDLPVSLMANRNSFGGKIRPEGFGSEYIPDHTKMWGATRGSSYDQIAQGLAKVGISVSPEDMKETVRFMTGGVGTFIEKTAGAGVGLLQGEAPKLENTPVAGDFYKSFDDTKALRSSMFDAAEDAKLALGRAKAGTASDDEIPLARLGKQTDKYTKAQSKLAEAIREVQASDMTNDDKEKAIEEMEEKMNRVSRAYLHYYRTALARSEKKSDN